MSVPQAHTVRLVLGDQLNPLHSWYRVVDPGVVYLMMEVRQETDYVLHHAQKILAVFAAMRSNAEGLRQQGHRVHYIDINDPGNRPTIAENLVGVLACFGARRFEYQWPDEWRLDQQLRTFQAPGVDTVLGASTEHFYTQRTDVAALFAPGKPWLMERFYRKMRVQHRVLMDPTGQPEGGRWNFDADNRKAWPGWPQEPPDPRHRHDHRALWAEIEAAGVASFGEPQAHGLPWPVNREQALEQLAAFVEQGLPYFGDYQDALSSRANRLFHSLLSFALNVKLLHPREVVDAAEQAYRTGAAPLAAVEGFVRQIVGWREYVRGFYWAHMPGYEQSNVLGHTAPLPVWFWTGQTQMRCVAHAITQSLEQAHAHHIQRLMVIGNFALLAGLDPAAVHRWYLGVYVDAFEWVELPNTVGMSQHADGGLMATKPYVSSAAYIDRMGDLCKGCAYDKKQRTGDRACPFNALYWDFFDRHAGRFAGNPRLAMVYRQLERMGADARSAFATQAQAYRDDLDRL